MAAPYPIKTNRREQDEFDIVITGAGAATPTVDHANVLDATTPVTREDVGLLTLNLKKPAVKLVGLYWGYGKSDYDTGAARKRIVRRAVDVKSAQTIKIAIENASTDALADLGATESVTIKVVLSYAVEVTG